MMKTSMLGCGDGREQLRQHQQRQPAQRVVDGQQQPRVDPVGEPAGGDRAGDVEDADQREQARPPSVVGMPWSCAAGMKWVPTSPLVVAPQIAKPPASSQNGRVRAAAAQRRRARARAALPVRRRRRRRPRSPPYGGRPDVGGVVAQQQQHERHDGERGAGDDQRRRRASRGRSASQATHAAGRSAGRSRRRGQHAGDQAAAA